MADRMDELLTAAQPNVVVPDVAIREEAIKLEKEADAVPLMDTFKAAQELESINLLFANRDELKPDPTFNGYDKNQWATLTEGLPEEYHQAFGDATSFEDALRMRGEYLREVNLEQKVSGQGFTGMGMRMAATFTDPEAWAVTLGSEGALAPFVLANRVGRTAKIIRAGVVAAGGNAAFEAAKIATRPTGGVDDVLFAAATGFAMGAPFGMLGRAEGQAFMEANSKLLNEVEVSQATGRIPTGGDVIATPGVGAASISTKETTPLTAQEFLDRVGPTEDTPFGSVRFDMSSSLKNSDNQVFRALGNTLFDDPLGTPKETATAWQNVEMGTRLNGFYRAMEDNYNNGYLKGKSWIDRMSISTRNTFFEDVSKVIRGTPSDNPHVNAMAKHMQDQFAELLDLAKTPKIREALDAPSVRGFEDVAENPQYLTRVWEEGKLNAARDRFGDKNVKSFLAQAIVRGSNDVELDEAMKVAEHLVKAVSASRYSRGVSLERILSKDSADTLTALLRDETDLEDGDIKALVDTVLANKGDGLSPRAKKRIRLDENYKATVGTANSVSGSAELSVSDFLNNDAERIFHSYLRQMTGQIALARQGITSKADFQNLLTNAEKEAGNIRMKKTDFQRQKEITEMAWKWLHGHSLEDDPGGIAASLLRQARDYNYARTMSQGGLASIPELGEALGQLGWKSIVTHVPELKRMMSRLQDGTLEDSLSNQLEVMFGGVGSTRLTTPITNRIDEAGFGAAADYPILQKTDQALQYSRRLANDLNFMNAVNQTLQRLTLKGIMQKFVDMASDGRINAKRMKDIGLPDEMLNRVLAQVRQHAKTQPSLLSKRKIKWVDEAAWRKTDPESFEAFRLAGNRLARRIVQEADLGETPKFVHGTWQKVMFQLRSFMLTSWAKKTLYGFKTRDVEAFNSFVLTSAIGGMTYVVRTHLNTLGEEKRNKMLKERLSVAAIGKAAFQNGGYSSIVPMTVDTAAMWITNDPIFSYRTTGLDSNIITGNPTYDLGKSLFNATGKSLQSTFTDKDFTQADGRSVQNLLIYNKMLGVAQVANKLINELPEK